MGYSGFVVIARTGDTRLDEVQCVDDLFVAVTDNVCARGWRIGFLGPVDDASPHELANDLAAETAAPAIALSVFDSDCAFATAADPSGAAVEFYLNEEMVRAHYEDGRDDDDQTYDDQDDDDQFEPLNGQAVAGLLAWARAAGLVASPDRLAAALDESPGPFGDGIFEFTEALGIAKLPE